MKRLVSIIVAALLILNCLAFAAPASAEGKALKIVATIFPEYDWVVAVLGENPAGIQVTLLLDSGVDLHSYQGCPRAQRCRLRRGCVKKCGHSPARQARRNRMCCCPRPR